jgi:hypothetical protein
MKKKAFAIACATIFTFFSASCDSGLFADKKEASLVVNGDYGVTVQGKVTYLLAGSSIFFNYDEYDVEELILGDVVQIEYTGDMLIRESSPSQIGITGKLIDVDVEEAEIVKVSYDGVNVVAEDVKGYTFENVPQYVIKDGSGSFVALEEMAVNATLYATYCENNVKGKTIYLDGLYAYLPRR